MDREVADLEQLRTLKARYVRAVDTQDWGLLRSTIADDAHFDGFAYPTTTADEFVSGVAGFFEGVESVHQVFSPEFSLIGPGVIRGIWALQDLLTWAPDSHRYKDMSLPGQWGLLGFGHYEEEYRLDGGQWRISFLRVTRLRIIPLVGTMPDSLPYPTLPLTPHWLDGPDTNGG